MANLSTFDLNLLRVLDALLREGSTVRAAERLGLSQPAVSAALSRLRAALGDPLFLCRGQGLQPTHFAQSLELELRQVLDRVADLLQGPPHFDPRNATDHFTLSGSDFFAELLMPSLAARFSHSAPGLIVHLVDLVPDNYVAALNRYEVDIALIPQTRLPDWVAAETLIRATFSVVARRDHPLIGPRGIAPGQVVPLDLFCSLGHVVFSPEGKSRAMGDAALARIGRERRVVVTLPVFSGVSRAVAVSDLIALLPTALAHDVASRAGLSVYRAPLPIDPVILTMAWHKRFTNSPGHQWLRGEIRGLMACHDTGAAETD